MNTKKIVNIAAFVLVVIGVIFKANHWPGANVSIILSGATMLCSVLLFGWKENQEAGMPNRLNILFNGVLALFIVGILFKLMHWPGAGVFVVVCYLIAFMIPVFLTLLKTEFSFPRQFFVTFFTYFILLIALFPKSPLTTFFNEGKTLSSETSAAPVQTQTIPEAIR